MGKAEVNMLTEKYSKEINENFKLHFTRQGQSFQVRPLKESDLGLVADLLIHLSRETLFLRFMTPYPLQTLADALEKTLKLWITNTQLVVVMLATVEIDGVEQAIGIGEVNRLGEGVPVEIGLVVRDDFQQKGVGSALVYELSEFGKRQGINSWQAVVQTENRGVLDFARKLGVAFNSKRDRELIELKGNL
jgi:acetyltransferase